MKSRWMRLAGLLTALAAGSLGCGSTDSDSGAGGGPSGGMGGAGATGGSGGSANSSGSGGSAGSAGGSGGAGGAPGECPYYDQYTLLAKAIYSKSFGIDATYVYFGRSTALEFVPLAGGSEQTLVDDFSARDLTVHSGNIYSQSKDALLTVPVGGGTPVTLHEEPALSDLYAFRVDDTYAYLQSESLGGLYKLPLAGGEPVEVVAETSELFAVDATTAYYAYAQPPEIRSAPLSGGSSTVLTSAAPSMLTVDDDAVYFVEANQIFRMSKDGSNKTQLSGFPGHTVLWSLAQDDANLYVGTGDSGCNGIAAIPKDGGPAKVLANDIPNEIMWLEVDATHVYFEHILLGAADIRRLPK